MSAPGDMRGFELFALCNQYRRRKAAGALTKELTALAREAMVLIGKGTVSDAEAHKWVATLLSTYASMPGLLEEADQIADAFDAKLRGEVH